MLLHLVCPSVWKHKGVDLSASGLWQFSAAGREEVVLFCVIPCCLCLSDHKVTSSKLSLVESETESQMGCLWSGRLLSWP